MTNIIAERILRNIILISDSIGSIPEIQSKDDSVQKLHKKGDNLILTAGREDLILNTINYTKEDNLPVNQFVYELFETAQEENKRCKTSASFIVAGQISSKTPILYKVLIDGKNSFVSKREPLQYDGCASRYIDEYLRCSKDLGKDPSQLDIVESFSRLYDLAKYTSQDTFVNDKFQIGIVTPKGISRLYFPEMKFNKNEDKSDYLSELLQTKNTQEKIITTVAFQRQSEKLVEIFYNSFNSDLKNYHNIKKLYTKTTEQYFKGDCDIEDLNSLVNERKILYDSIEKGINVLINKGITNIIEYNDYQHKRQNALNENLLKYLK